MLAMEFDAYGLSVKDYRTKEVLHRCDSTGDLYPIVSATPSSSPTAFTSTAVPQDTWHGRLGHPGITSSFNKRFPCNNSKNLCEACQLGKHVRLPFCNSSSKSSAAFDLIHSIFGPPLLVLIPIIHFTFS
jgi:hypothetical protein